MKVTQRQQALITRYIRDVSIQLESKVRADTRERGLVRLQTHIYRSLEALAKDVVENGDVEAVLARLGAPRRRAEAMLSTQAPPKNAPERSAPAKYNAPAQTPPPARRPRTGDAPVWLGVCAFYAERTGLEVAAVRWLALLMGLAGPFAILAYLGGYALIYFDLDQRHRPKIDARHIALRMAGAFTITLALFLGAGWFKALVVYFHREWLHMPAPYLGGWDWLDAWAASLFMGVLLTGLPLAALSAMPLANAWDQSLKRVLQAVLVLYAAGLSLGVASFLVGLLLDVARQFAA